MSYVVIVIYSFCILFQRKYGHLQCKLQNSKWPQKNIDYFADTLGAANDGAILKNCLLICNGGSRGGRGVIVTVFICQK